MPDGLTADPKQTLVEDRFAAGYRFGQYEIIDHIGSGGMAEVYEATHVVLEKRVALKVMSRLCAKKDPLRRRFLREGKRAASIRHDHVVDITDVGETDGLPYLVMEYLDGETLGQRLDREVRMPVQEAIHLIVPVIAASWAGHRKGVVHRDLKPENILLAREGAQRVRPKVLDFGVSRGVGDEDQNLTLPNAVLGTPIYMSPEQARGDDTDERSDQYSLAVVLYEMITGEVPRQTADTLLKAINTAAAGEIIPPSTYLPDIDSDLEAVFLRALAQNPIDRFDDLPTFALALLDWASPRAREYWAQEFGNMPPLADSYGPPSVSGEHLLSRSDRARSSSKPVPSSAPPVDSVPPVSSSPAPAAVAPLPTTTQVMEPEDKAPAGGDTTESVVPPSPTTPPAESKGDSRIWLGLLLLVGLVGLIGWKLVGEEPAPAGPAAPPAPAKQTYPIHLEVLPAEATIELDGELVGKGSYSSVLPKDGSKHTVVYRAEGHRERVVTFQDVGPPSATVELEPLAPPEAPSAEPSAEPNAVRPPTRPPTVKAKVEPTPEPTPSAKPEPEPPPPTPSWKVDKPSDNKDPWKN